MITETTSTSTKARPSKITVEVAPTSKKGAEKKPISVSKSQNTLTQSQSYRASNMTYTTWNSSPFQTVPSSESLPWSTIFSTGQLIITHDSSVSIVLTTTTSASRATNITASHVPEASDPSMAVDKTINDTLHTKSGTTHATIFHEPLPTSGHIKKPYGNSTATSSKLKQIVGSPSTGPSRGSKSPPEILTPTKMVEGLSTVPAVIKSTQSPSAVESTHKNSHVLVPPVKLSSIITTVISATLTESTTSKTPWSGATSTITDGLIQGSSMSSKRKTMSALSPPVRLSSPVTVSSTWKSSKQPDKSATSAPDTTSTSAGNKVTSFASSGTRMDKVPSATSIKSGNWVVSSKVMVFSSTSPWSSAATHESAISSGPETTSKPLGSITRSSSILSLVPPVLLSPARISTRASPSPSSTSSLKSAVTSSFATATEKKGTMVVSHAGSSDHTTLSATAVPLRSTSPLLVDSKLANNASSLSHSTKTFASVLSSPVSSSLPVVTPEFSTVSRTPVALTWPEKVTGSSKTYSSAEASKQLGPKPTGASSYKLVHFAPSPLSTLKHPSSPTPASSGSTPVTLHPLVASSKITVTTTSDRSVPVKDVPILVYTNVPNIAQPLVTSLAHGSTQPAVDVAGSRSREMQHGAPEAEALPSHIWVEQPMRRHRACWQACGGGDSCLRRCLSRVGEEEASKNGTGIVGAKDIPVERREGKM